MALPESADDVFVNDPLPQALNETRHNLKYLDTEVEKRIEKPAGAMFGDLLRWNGLAWETTETRFLEGEGRPDGVVAAPVGSRYIDKVGAQGAVEWVKRSGNDTNTGWICLAGDTGRRDVSGMIQLRTTGIVYSAYLMRMNNVVEFYVSLKMPTNDTSPYTFFTLPVGFRPRYSRFGGLTDSHEGADKKGTVVHENGQLQILNPVSDRFDRYSGNWLTADAWPANLPGSAG